MAKYVDGFVLVVPKKKLKAYRAIAAKAGKLWKKYGALEYMECVGDDLHGKYIMLPFSKLAKTKPSEAVVFSFIVYKSRAHRDAVNAKAMKDPVMDEWKDKPMPFDMKRMASGGFKAIVDL